MLLRPLRTVAASDVQTTEEELEGFNIVRAIAAAEIDPERVVHRDGKVYFAILLDDNNRKPLIRLHLNAKNKKFVTTFEAGKEGTRRDIESVVDIYRAGGEAIRATIRLYEAGKGNERSLNLDEVLASQRARDADALPPSPPPDRQRQADLLDELLAGDRPAVLAEQPFSDGGLVRREDLAQALDDWLDIHAKTG